MKLTIALLALAFVAVAFANENQEKSGPESTDLNTEESLHKIKAWKHGKKYGKRDTEAVETDLVGEEHKWKKYGYYPVHPYYPRYYAPVYHGKKHFRGRRAADTDVQAAEETDMTGEEHKWKKYSRYYAPVSHYYPTYYPAYPSYHTKGFRGRRSVDEETDMTADEHKWRKYGGYYPRYYGGYYPRYYGGYYPRYGGYHY